MHEYLGEVSFIFDLVVDSFLLDGVPVVDDDGLFVEFEPFAFADFISNARVGHCIDIFMEG